MASATLSAMRKYSYGLKNNANAQTVLMNIHSVMASVVSFYYSFKKLNKMRKLQKTEVRIGNYFIFVDSFDCRENDDINQITEHDFEDSDFMWDRKLPLEISQYILKKFGFKLNEDTSIWHFGCYQVYENDLGHFEFCFFRYGEWHQPIEYVHELQNIYFCISSGEELVFSTEP